MLSHSVVSDSLQPHGLQSARLLCSRGFSRQEYWSGLPCPPPGDLPNPWIEPGLPHCRRILHCLNHQGSPRILECVGYPFSWRRRWHPTPVLLPGKSHGRRSPVGCSPWGLSELDRTERLHFHFSPSCIGEGNGNPLQYSCLENPRDGGAWWAAVYEVAQSRT